MIFILYEYILYSYLLSNYSVLQCFNLFTQTKKYMQLQENEIETKYEKKKKYV